MPVTNDCATNGRITWSNSLGRVSGFAFGMPDSAITNSGLVDGAVVGVGAMPKLGGVVSGTTGSAPRFTLPSATAFTPGCGFSWLPATSVASARNSYVCPASPTYTKLPSATATSRCQTLKSPPSVATYSVR